MSSALCSLNVNKISRVFSWFFFWSVKIHQNAIQWTKLSWSESKLNITYLCEIVITVINEFLQVSVVEKLIFLLAGLHVFAKVGLLNVLDIGPRRGQKWGKGFKVIVFNGFVDFSNDGQKLTKLKTKISKKF